MLAKERMKSKDFTNIITVRSHAKGISQALNFKLKRVMPATISKRPNKITIMGSKERVVFIKFLSEDRTKAHSL